MKLQQNKLKKVPTFKEKLIFIDERCILGPYFLFVKFNMKTKTEIN
jgi:hypothetical protein